MINKSITLIILAITISAIFYACDLGRSGGKYKTEYSIDSLELQVGHLYSQNSSYYQLSPFDQSQLTDTLNHEDFGFEIRVSAYHYETARNNPSEGFISSAMADPVPPHSKSLPSLISIYSDQNVYIDSQTFAAGDNLTNAFEAYFNYGDWKSVLQTLNDIYEWYEYEHILLRLKTKPDSLIHQSFTFKVTMDDGQIFEMESPKLMIE